MKRDTGRVPGDEESRAWSDARGPKIASKSLDAGKRQERIPLLASERAQSSQDLDLGCLASRL